MKNLLNQFLQNKTIPNYLSVYRILIFPIIILLIIFGYEKIFITMLVINLITDIIDGYLARKLKLETEIGARLDSIADIGTYILAFVGIFVFKLKDFQEHTVILYIYIALYISTHTLTWVKFGRFASLHLYSSKISGYLQGVFIFVLFVFGFNTILYYFVMIFSIISLLEHILVQLLLKEMKSNQKGIYWLLKSKNK